MNIAEGSLKTRDKILETGLKLISEKGYLGATTREIAKEAGIAEVTLFRHFPSKEKLFEEVLNTYSFLPALRGLMPEIKKMPYQEALILIARRYLDTLTLRKDMIRIMHSEVRLYPEKIHKIYRTFVRETVNTLASYFNEVRKKGQLGQFDADLAARAFLGIFFSYFNAQEFHMLKACSPADTEKTIKEFVSIFVRGTLKR